MRSSALSVARSSQSYGRSKVISSIDGLNLSALSLSPFGGVHYSTHKMSGLEGDDEDVDAVHIGGFDIMDDGEMDGEMEMHSPRPSKGA